MGLTRHQQPGEESHENWEMTHALFFHNLNEALRQGVIHDKDFVEISQFAHKLMASGEFMATHRLCIPDINDEMTVISDTLPPWITAPVDEPLKTYFNNVEVGSTVLAELSQNDWIHYIRAHQIPNADSADMINAFNVEGWADHGPMPEPNQVRRHLVVQIQGSDVLKV